MALTIKTIEMDLTIAEGLAVRKYIGRLRIGKLPDNSTATGLHKIMKKLDETMKEIAHDRQD